MTEGCVVTSTEDEEVGEILCHRCADSLMLSVRVPRSFHRADGVEVLGFRTVGLCARCDAANPAASALLDFFGSEHVGSEPEFSVLARLLGQWLMEILFAQLEEGILAGLSEESRES